MRHARVKGGRGWKGALGIVFFLLVFTQGHAQKQIRGIVIDSATFAPLPMLTSDSKVCFTVQRRMARGNSRSPFSKKIQSRSPLLGTTPKKFAAAELDETAVIRMTEAVRILETVTVMPKDQKALPSLHLAPSGKLMNYGYSGAGVNFAYFSKLEKEKRKLRVGAGRTGSRKKLYGRVCSPDFRDRITEEFKISDDEYYGLLARFNIENGDGLYHLSSEELVVVLTEYYKRNTRRR